MFGRVLLILFALFLGTIVAATILAFTWGKQQLQAVDLTDTTIRRFVIPKGASTARTAELLKEKKLIKNPLVFRAYARYSGLDRSLQAGAYDLAPSMSVFEITQTLQQGSKAIWLTLPEGMRVEEVAERLTDTELTDFDAEQFITMAKPNEGRIFPDTYLVPRESSAEQLFTLFTDTFQEKVETGLSTELASSERPVEEILILASLIQREGRTPEDMGLIAGVLDNRLKQGMKLDIDATLSYLRGYDEAARNWWSAPTIDLKNVDSPYNTYKVSGLPPTPIASPGLSAIRAALDPTPTAALFYLHAPDGEAYFAETLAEHSANIERYLR